MNHEIKIENFLKIPFIIYSILLRLYFPSFRRETETTSDLIDILASCYDCLSLSEKLTKKNAKVHIYDHQNLEIVTF